MGLLSKLSILIVTYRGDDLLYNCLSSLQNACEEMPEIVVVDNSANDATKRLVEAYPTAKYVASETNLGFAGGNNLGLPYCTKPYVLLLNNDTIIHKEPFTQLIEYLENNPRVAVVQGKMRLVRQGEVLDSCGIMLTPMGLLYDRYAVLDIDKTNVPTRPVHSIKGAMMVIRQEIIQKVGGLFYNHFHSNYEETDFCHRAWLGGYEVHFVDTYPIDHLQGQTISRLNQIDVLGRTYANQLFSFMTTLEMKNAIKMSFSLMSLLFCIAVYNLLKCQISFFRIFMVSIKSLWHRRREVYNTRKNIQKMRVVTDKEIFQHSMSKLDLCSYFHMLKGDWVNYNRRRVIVDR